MIAAEEEGDASMYGRSADASGRLLPAFAELRLRLGPCAVITVTPNDSTYPKPLPLISGLMVASVLMVNTGEERLLFT